MCLQCPVNHLPISPYHRGDSSWRSGWAPNSWQQNHKIKHQSCLIIPGCMFTHFMYSSSCWIPMYIHVSVPCTSPHANDHHLISFAVVVSVLSTSFLLDYNFWGCSPHILLPRKSLKKRIKTLVQVVQVVFGGFRPPEDHLGIIPSARHSSPAEASLPPFLKASQGRPGEARDVGQSPLMEVRLGVIGF